MRDCAAASTQGRRCAAKALTIDAIDECLAMRADPAPDDTDLSDKAPD